MTGASSRYEPNKRFGQPSRRPKKEIVLAKAGVWGPDAAKRHIQTPYLLRNETRRFEICAAACFICNTHCWRCTSVNQPVI